MKKYELILEDSINLNNTQLFRIRALIDFGNVRKGELGGYISNENNLLHSGCAWVTDNAIVTDNAVIAGDAIVGENAKISDNVVISGQAKVAGNVLVSGYVKIFESPIVIGNTVISGNALIAGSTLISGNATISGKVRTFGHLIISGDTVIKGDEIVHSGNAFISGDARIESNKDYYVFKNTWSSGRWFTYTRSNKMWRVGCFYGTGEELITKAYSDSELSGRHYEMFVNFVNELEKI